MKVNVLIADDHKIVREGIKAMLRDEGWITITGEASDGEEVLEFLERKNIDIVLLDIDMPCMDGICCSKNIRQYWPKTKVLIISMHQSEKFVVEAFRAGAAGFISKDSCKAELVSAIRALYEGNSYFSHEASQKLLKCLNRPVGERDSGTPPDEPILTSRETEVLALIAKEYTNHEIAERLFISPHTVVSHRRNLLQKLNAKNTAGLMRYATRYGLIRYE